MLKITKKVFDFQRNDEGGVKFLKILNGSYVKKKVENTNLVIF